MKYEVIEEKSLNEGNLETWYLVEPRNKFFKFIQKIFLFDVFNYSPHMTKEEALKEAELKSANRFNRIVSRKKV